MAAWFPSLRRTAIEPAPSKQLELTSPHLAPEAKALLVDYYELLQQSGLNLNDRAEPWPIERAIREGYERVMWCFRAVNTIGGNAARLDVPFRFWELDEHGKHGKPVKDHPLYRLLNRRANPMETGQVFLKRLSAQILLSKRGAFVEISRSRAGTPVRLDLLPPGRTRIVPGWDVPIDHYEITRLDGSRYEIDPDRVAWFRDPHPLDPYMGVTPLESAGYSVELDHFARLYNVMFMRNDGRPGTVVGVDGEMDDDDMDRLERRFEKGVGAAGKVTLLTGQVTVADLAATPRDSQYENVSANAKIELLAAFGVPESVLGNASGRTYDNAEAEAYTFWTTTMQPHLDMIASGFDDDIEDDIVAGFDTDAIEVLQIPRRKLLERARAEFAAGLRSPKSYADLAGYGDELDDTPQLRALYIGSGLQPLPTREDDAEALGMGTPAEEEPPPLDDPNALPVDDPAAEPGAVDPAADASAPEDIGALPPAPPGVTLLPPDTGTGAEVKAAKGAWAEVKPLDVEAIARRELERVFAPLLSKWIDRTATRLRSPKIRKGTRHWQAQHAVDTRVGTKAIDAAYAAAEDQWAADAEEAAEGILAQLAIASALGFLTAAAAQAGAVGVTAPSASVLWNAAENIGKLPPMIRALLDSVKVTGKVLDGLGEDAGAVLPRLGAQARAEARATVRAAIEADADGAPLDDLVAAVRGRADDLDAWAEQVAADMVGAVAEATQGKVASLWADEAPVEIGRQWLTRKDPKVRAAHSAAHGQTRPVGASFRVGGALLRFPGDPLGPPELTMNCRCRTVWRQRSNGRFVLQVEGDEAAS